MVIKFRHAVAIWCGVPEPSDKVYRRYYIRLKKSPNSVFRTVEFDETLKCKTFDVVFVKIHSKWYVTKESFNKALDEMKLIRETKAIPIAKLLNNLLLPTRDSIC